MSFRYAFDGLKTLFSEEHNAWIHLVATIVVITAGLLLKINRFEWIAIGFCIGLVFILELINSAIERLSDVVLPEKNESIKKVKDLAAAAVLFGAIISVVVGLLIFLPKLLLLF